MLTYLHKYVPNTCTKNYVIFWGEGGGHQKITMDYRGEGGKVWGVQKGVQKFLMVPSYISF